MTTMPMPRGGSFFSRPDEPFIWGRGGKRLSQDDIAMQRQLAARNMAAGSDYSPIQSPWQGFARVAQGLAGGMQMRSADKASAANAETTQQAIEAALAQPGPVEGGNDPVTALLANPQTQALGMQLLKARQPQQVEDKDAVIRLSRIANDPTQPEWLRRDAQAQLDVINDPLSVITNTAGTQILPRSMLLGDGVSQQQPASFPPPPPEAVLDLIQNPQSAAQFDEVFGPGASAQVFAARQGFREFTGR